MHRSNDSNVNTATMDTCDESYCYQQMAPQHCIVGNVHSSAVISLHICTFAAIHLIGVKKK